MCLGLRSGQCSRLQVAAVARWRFAEAWDHLAESMAQYDPTVLQNYADSLYRKAQWMSFICAVGGAAIGGGTAYAMGRFAVNPYTSPVAIAVLAGLGALFGAAVGHKWGVEYRFEAQKLLCQMQIEQNTRK